MRQTACLRSLCIENSGWTISSVGMMSAVSHPWVPQRYHRCTVVCSFEYRSNPFLITQQAQRSKQSPENRQRTEAYRFASFSTVSLPIPAQSSQGSDAFGIIISRIADAFVDGIEIHIVIRPRYQQPFQGCCLLYLRIKPCCMIFALHDDRHALMYGLHRRIRLGHE
jgi:hypothetical protein